MKSAQIHPLKNPKSHLEIPCHRVRPDVQGMRLAGMAILEHPELSTPIRNYGDVFLPAGQAAR